MGIGVLTIMISLLIDKIPGNLVEVSVKTSGLFIVPLFLLFFMALFVPFATPFGTVFGALYSFLAAALVSYWDVITHNPPNKLSVDCRGVPICWPGLWSAL